MSPVSSNFQTATATECAAVCLMCPAPQAFDVLVAGGLGLRKTLSPQATRNLIRLGSKRAEALEVLTAQVAVLHNTLQVCPPLPPPPPLHVSASPHACQPHIAVIWPSLAN